MSTAVSEKNLDGGGQKIAGCAFRGTKAVASWFMAASVQAATAAAVSVTVANNGLRGFATAELVFVPT